MRCIFQHNIPSCFTTQEDFYMFLTYITLSLAYDFIHEIIIFILKTRTFFLNFLQHMSWQPRCRASPTTTPEYIRLAGEDFEGSKDFKHI